MIATKLFGLEESILTKCTIKEIRRYKRLANFFITLIVIGCIAFYYFFYLLTQNYISALFGSLIISFIYFAILRFTIITINVSLHEEMSMKRMWQNYANTYRVILFAAFIITILVPLIALINHNSFSVNLNNYKNSLNTQYQNNRFKAKKQQLQILIKEINNLKNQKNSLTKKLLTANGSMEKGLTEFEIKKIDTLINRVNNKLLTKDSILTTENITQIKQYESKIKSAELPFFRFQLVFKNTLSVFLLIGLFFCFILIIPFYIRVLVSKDSEYAKLFKEEIKNRILKEYNRTTTDCSNYLMQQYSYTINKSTLYKDSPFNHKPITLPYQKVTTKNLFEHFQNTENLKSLNE
jgi:hypothetical protein